MKIDKYYNQNSADTGNRNEKPQEHEHRPHMNETIDRIGKKLDSLIENRWIVLGIAIVIILINVVLRTGLLQYQGLFEPDGFFYYTVIREIVNNHMLFGPHISSLSGFPLHNPIGESPGLMAVTTIPYYILSFTGITFYTVMRWMPIVFGVLEAILAYFIAKHLSDSRALGLLAMFFISVSSGNIARTAGAVYRGDSFISLFLMVALLFMLRAYSSKDRKWIYINSVIAAVALSLGLVVWNGSPFVIVVYIFSIVLVLIYSFIMVDEKLTYINFILSLCLLLTFGLQSVYVSLHMANPNLVFGPGPDGLLYVALFYVPLILANLLVWYFIRKSITNSPILNNEMKRAAISVGVILVFAIIMLVSFKDLVAGITNQAGVVVPLNTNKTVVPIGQTTQELQPPSYGFLTSSFSIQLSIGALVGYALGLSPAIGNNIVVLFTLLFAWIGILLFAFFAHRHAHPKHSTKSISVNGINMTVNAPILVMLAYAGVTTYLQLAAIRFNALISIPLAILVAYTIYVIAMLLHEAKARDVIAIVIALCAAAFAAYLLYNFRTVVNSPFTIVDAVSIIMYAILGILIVYCVYAIISRRLELKYVVLAFILVALVYNFYNTYFESYTAAQADGINPQFLQAMTWLKNNTPSNATVLALWPDGSVVEGWGNRTSYMDSVGGENGTRIYNFSKWLFNTSPDSQYLYKIHKPEYLIGRNFWYEELGGIAQEGLVQNASEYGYIILNGLNSTNNGTAQFFMFSQNTYPYYRSELVVIPEANGITRYHAYLGTANSTRFAEMRSIMFLNTSTSQYSFLNNTNVNSTINFTLLLSYSGHNINGAYILGPKLVQSNLFKFTFLCNYNTCPYNTSNTKMNVVYMNGDTRILKIDYSH